MGPGKRTFLTPGRQWKAPTQPLRRSLLADCSLPSTRPGLAAWGVPRNSVAASLLRGPLLGATMQLEVVAAAKLPAHPFVGALGGPPWAGKLLTIPILNTSVMVYGPSRDNYGVQNLAFMAPFSSPGRT